MSHIMFDVDGTLVQSYEFDEECFNASVEEVTGIKLAQDWDNYPNVTARGLLMTFIENQAPHYALEDLEAKVKEVFIKKIEDYLSLTPALEVQGAKDFVNTVVENDKFLVSLATGGWAETAILKLQSAGFDTDKLIISSSNEHYRRIDIMKNAKNKVGDTKDLPITYFGDAIWDVRACAEMDVNLVIIGNRVSHHQTLPNFSCIKSAFDYVI